MHPSICQSWDSYIRPYKGRLFRRYLREGFLFFACNYIIVNVIKPMQSHHCHSERSEESLSKIIGSFASLRMTGKAQFSEIGSGVECKRMRIRT